MGYELLDDNLTESTLWMFGSKDAKLLMITILSKCRGSDIVRTPIPVLIKLAGLTLEEGEAALAELEAPDPHSKFPGEEGRRIVKMNDGEGPGLRLPSYKPRRNRYLTRERVAKLRERNAVKRSVTAGNEKFASEAEAEADTEPRVKKTKINTFIPPTIPEVQEFCEKHQYDVDAVAFVAHYEANGWKVGKNAMKKWKAAVITWERKKHE